MDHVFTVKKKCSSRNKLNLYIMKTATWGKVEMIFVFKFAPNYRYTVCKFLKTLELQCYLCKSYANLMHNYLYFKISLISLFMNEFPLTAVDVFVGMPWGNTTFTKHWTTHESSGSTMSLKSTITRKFHRIVTCSFLDEHLISKFTITNQMLTFCFSDIVSLGYCTRWFGKKIEKNEFHYVQQKV